MALAVSTRLVVFALTHMLLFFVKVRSQAVHSLASVYCSIAKNKKIALQRACNAYINQIKYSSKHIRFDGTKISISEEGNGELKHYNKVTLFF